MRDILMYEVQKFRFSVYRFFKALSRAGRCSNNVISPY